jgi:hypothetical protein
MVLLRSQLVSAPAVEMALCIRTAPPGCPRAREEHAEHVVVSYTNCLSLVYSSLHVSILQEAEMMLKGPDRLQPSHFLSQITYAGPLKERG